MPEPILLYLDDLIEMRKPHPCGGRVWRVVRLGAEIGLRCETCGRKVWLPRAELARRMRCFVARGSGAA